MSYREEDVRELMDAARSLAYTIPIGVPITVQSSLASAVLRVVARLHSKSLSKNQPEAQANNALKRLKVVPLLTDDGLYHDCPNGFVLQRWLNQLEDAIEQRFNDLTRKLDGAVKEISDIKEREAVEFNRKQFVPEPVPTVTGEGQTTSHYKAANVEELKRQGGWVEKPFVPHGPSLHAVLSAQQDNSLEEISLRVDGVEAKVQDLLDQLRKMQKTPAPSAAAQAPFSWTGLWP